ncbi:MAG: aldehyde ferredoxin oxidoreductase family protein [Desulfobulbaceae bacterium]|nr:aldehyde ferredoxin oxidoreductase family protein [Desulfobulbaceae bacterium]
MHYGWTGKILHINLSSGEIDVIRPDREIYTKFIGGKGLAGLFLRPHVTLPWDNPDMPVLFFTGPLVGTIAPTSGRSTVMSRSPLTGTVADCSVGGRLGFQLKRAGWDGIIITGKSDRLCSVEIENDDVRIHDAEKYRHQDTGAIFDIFDDGSRSVAAVGPAAENGVRFASLMVDKHHAAGRNGIGLCLGAKNIKFLTVHGTGKIPVHNKQELLVAREEIMRLTAASPILMGEHGFSCFGTGSIYDLMDSRRMMPTDNFRKTRFDRAGELNAFAYKESYHPKKYGCMGCHIRCKKIIETGKQSGVSMPEFETMSHFTALIGNTDMKLVVKANELCNRLGMDTISAASTLACYRELHGDIDLSSQLTDLLTQMGTGSTELGRELGQGSAQYARDKQLENGPSMSVKGLELPAYDPRGAYGMSLAYALSTRGGCHLRAYPVSHEILRKPVATDRFTFSGKARIIKIAEDQNAVVDSLTACKFIFFAAGLEEYARAYSAVTGEESTAQDLLKVGERIYYQERIMNSLNGFGAADDDLPRRFFTEAGSGEGAMEIKPLDREAFLEARARYYRIRGLDQQGGPTPEKTQELGLA